MECTCRQAIIAGFVLFAAILLFTGSQAAPATTAIPTSEVVTIITEIETTEVAATNASATNASATVTGITTIDPNATTAANGSTVAPNGTATTPAKGTTGSLTTENPDKGSTEKPGTPGNPTETPKPQKNKDSGFDAASFIGGMALAAGVIAIGFFGYKFYQSRQEKSYTQF